MVKEVETPEEPARDQRPDLSLVMPCYNEEEAVEGTIRDLFETFSRKGHALEVVAVDNGSTDRTLEILRGLVGEFPDLVPVRVDVNQGYGHGLLSGLSSASGGWIGIICADGQVGAADVEKLFAVVRRSPGRKLLKVRRRFRMDGWRRKIVSVAYNGIITAMFGGLGSIDVNGNPKLMPAEDIRRMKLRSSDWFLDAEIMIKAKRLKLPVFEVNVLAQMREGGVSNVNTGTMREFIANLVRWRFRRTPEMNSDE